MTGSLDGRTALVTGASAGIGRATAIEFAREGANVSIAARRSEQLEEIAAAIEADHGVDVLVRPTDVTDESQVDTMVEETVSAFGSLDAVVNNAGVGHDTAIEDMSTEEYRRVMGVNADGMFFTTRAAIPHLRDAGGALVFIGSVAGEYPRATYPLYAASKWWTRGFALSLAGQIGTDDIAVSVVNPTGIRTEFGSDYRQPNRERFDEGEWPTPSDVAEAVIFAATQESPAAIGEIDVLRRAEFSD